MIFSHMGSEKAERQTDPSGSVGRPVVAFDFDGTLTISDSFLAYLRWRRGALAYARGVGRLAPRLLAYLLSRDAGRLKAAAVEIFLKGETAEDVAEEAQSFAATHADALLRPDAVRTFEGRRRAGERVGIVTASPELTVAPFARRLGADFLIGTRLEIDAGGRLTGRLSGPNCRGPEKVVRLREAFGPALRLAAAYGDTSGDAEMLKLAAEGFWRPFKERP